MAATTHPLIDADELAHLLREPAAARPVVLDASFDLADVDAGERAYAEAHLPGSLHVHLDRDLCGAKTGANGRHPLPDRAAFAATLGRLGIAPATAVVALDRQGGVYAARLWWMLRWIGHDAVRVLDGGLDAWRRAGGALEQGESASGAAPPGAAPYPVAAAPAMATIEADALLAALGRLALVDARAPERFRGDVEPLDAVAGHIPGALNRFYRANLGADGRFKPAETLRAELGAAIGTQAPSDVVHSCGSGVTACHNLLAMAVAGLDGARLYPGSWSEWSADPRRPVARG